MPNKNGQNYLCFLPKVEKAKSGKPVSQLNMSSMIVETEKRVKLKTPDELLEVLKGSCFIRVSICDQQLFQNDNLICANITTIPSFLDEISNLATSCAHLFSHIMTFRIKLGLP